MSYRLISLESLIASTLYNNLIFVVVSMRCLLEFQKLLTQSFVSHSFRELKLFFSSCVNPLFRRVNRICDPLTDAIFTYFFCKITSPYFFLNLDEKYVDAVMRAVERAVEKTSKQCGFERFHSQSNAASGTFIPPDSQKL